MTLAQAQRRATFPPVLPLGRASLAAAVVVLVLALTALASRASGPHWLHAK